MQRRDFLRFSAATAAVPALLRAGALEDARREAHDTYQRLGMKYYIFNVKDYGIKGDGKTDDWEALQALFERTKKEVGKSKTYYFPAGRYLASKTVHLFRHPDTLNYGCQIIGQGPMLSQIVLAPNAKGFGDPDNPRSAFAYHATAGQESLGMLIDSLAILADEDGSNPGTIGLEWKQHGGISRNLVAQAGHTCFHLSGYAFRAAIENVTCLGGRIGMSLANCNMLRNVRCLGFSECGVRVRRSNTKGAITVTDLHTRGRGPGLQATNAGICLISARMEADPPGQPAAIDLSRDGTGLSSGVNLQTIGYKDMLADRVPAPASGAGAVSLFADRNYVLPDFRTEVEHE